VAVFVAYFTFSEPRAPGANLQVRYFLPIAAALTLALPRRPLFGLVTLPIAFAGLTLLMLVAQPLWYKRWYFVVILFPDDFTFPVALQ
jgi:hypothetical protein